MNLDDIVELESITLPSREEIKEAYEFNKYSGSGSRVVVVDELTGHQTGRVKRPHEQLEPHRIQPKRFIWHHDQEAQEEGKNWQTRHDAKHHVFNSDQYPEITPEREDEFLGTKELENAVDDVWEEMKEHWWSEAEFVSEIEFENGHTINVIYEEDTKGGIA